jgi:hypothetical protein
VSAAHRSNPIIERVNDNRLFLLAGNCSSIPRGEARLVRHVPHCSLTARSLAKFSSEVAGFFPASPSEATQIMSNG